jgi:antitoxin (DNA-binding transcriptional repressor) of toxin-antitoxin stability system
MSATKVQITELRDHLADFLDLVCIQRQTLDIFRRGKIVAHLVPEKKEKEDYLVLINRVKGILKP